MSVKNILTYNEFPHILKGKSLPVQLNDPNKEDIIRDLKDTLLHTENGVGLAAPQIGVQKRIFVLKKDMLINDLAKDSFAFKIPDSILVFINPKIIAKKGSVLSQEGCLSVPGYAAGIQRSKTVTVRALSENGSEIHEKFKGLASMAIQQEMDHLDGVLITDYRE